MSVCMCVCVRARARVRACVRVRALACVCARVCVFVCGVFMTRVLFSGLPSIFAKLQKVSLKCNPLCPPAYNAVVSAVDIGGKYERRGLFAHLNRQASNRKPQTANRKPRTVHSRCKF